MPLSPPKLTSLPGKLIRRLLTVAEDLEAGSASIWRRRSPDCYTTVRALHRLAPQGLRTLYDIGANTGSWTQTFAAFFPELANAVLFEPAERSQVTLAALTLSGVNIRIAATALGRHAGEAQLRGGGPSASLLEATSLQNQFFPGSINNDEQIVPVTTLDEWVAQSGAPVPDIIKLDIQGAEADALAGGELTVSRARWLIIELSAIALYSGQKSAGATLDWLEQRGWRLAGMGYQWLNPRRELLQFDAILTQTGIA